MKDQLNSDREASLSNGMPKITAENVNVYYEEVHALNDVSVKIEQNAVVLTSNRP